VLTVWEQPEPASVAPRVSDFLCDLPGPVAIHQRGRDSSRCRLLVTLLHGNEPSGLEAVHQWLRNGEVPAVDTVFIIGSVAAARAEPLFYYRQLPGRRDLNRCFAAPYTDNEGLLARAIVQHIEQCQPEAVIDMHNTSGSSPGFAVATSASHEHRALVGLFVDYLILTDLRLGSLMEQPLGCPVVTIEAGGARDDAADRVASAGLRRYLMVQELFAREHELTLFQHPYRLELLQHSRIDYADHSLHDRDVTIREDIERYNFASVEAGAALGWLGEEGLAHLQVVAGDHRHPVAEFFEVRDGILTARSRMHLFMATTRPDIAASDCLFYFVIEQAQAVGS
jgi:hypothetical protein